MERTGSGGHSTRDLATFNHWLNISRLRAAAGVAVFVIVAHALGIRQLVPLPALAVSGALALLSGFCLLACPRRFEGSLAYFTLQTFGDLAAITIGIGLATEGLPGILIRPLYALVIVPASLISVPVGVAVATAATFGHGLLLALERGMASSTFLSVEFLAPVFIFYLIAQQSFFYGNHLEQKNVALAALATRLEGHRKELAVEARTSAALAEVARTLATTLEAPVLLARVNQTMLESLGADWAATFLVDEEGSTFRLGAASDPEVRGELDRVTLPLESWPVVKQLAAEPHLTLGPEEARRIPTPFTGGRPLASALIAGLYRESTLVGFLAVGYRSGTDAVPEWATRLLGGIAEHAGIVLHNARLLERVQVASQLKSEFVGTISHELRSPLNVILGYVEMVLDRALGPVTEEQAEVLDHTQGQALVLLDMINALLDLNRFEAGQLPIQSAPVALAQVLEEFRDELPESWRRPEVALHVRYPAERVMIRTDPGKLKTVLRNLVHNALKFTSEGEVTLVADLGPTGDVIFTVADTGPGIPRDALPYVFEMFRQVPGAGGGGVGLGLHIVHRFVEALGGHVEVTSEVGTGSRFTVTLLGVVISKADAA